MMACHPAQEYEGRGEDAELKPAQRLAKQRKSLKRQLGLDQAGMDQLVDTDDLIKDEDLVACGSAKSPAQTGQKDAASLISDMTGDIPLPRNCSCAELVDDGAFHCAPIYSKLFRSCRVWLC